MSNIKSYLLSTNISNSNYSDLKQELIVREIPEIFLKKKRRNTKMPLGF